MRTLAERRLRQFLKLSDKAELSPITRSMLTHYLELRPDKFREIAKTIPDRLEELEEKGLLGNEYVKESLKLIRRDPSSHKALYEQIFLFAAGSQLAYQEMTAQQRTSLRQATSLHALFEHDTIRYIAPSGFNLLYAYTGPGDSQHPDSVVITLGGAIAYTLGFLQGHTRAHREQYHDMAYGALQAGAEETIHAMQTHDPMVNASLRAPLVARYGENYHEERERQLAPTRGSAEAIDEFNRHDPIERDAEARLDKFRHRLVTLFHGFQSQKMQL
jgi:hypothetical protein